MNVRTLALTEDQCDYLKSVLCTSKDARALGLCELIADAEEPEPIPGLDYVTQTLDGARMRDGEIRLLQILWARRGKIVSLMSLYQLMWSEGNAPETWANTIHVYLCRLRKAAKSVRFETHWRQGIALWDARPDHHATAWQH